MEWTSERLEQQLQNFREYGGDTTSIEVKRASQGLPKTIGTTICAFANMPLGGTLILGVDEHDNFAVTGIRNPAEIIQGLVSVSRLAVVPAPTITTQTLRINNKQVVIADIANLPLSERPARFEGRAYLRQADGDYIMHEHELRMIESEKIRLDRPYDDDLREFPDTPASELLPELLEDYLDSTRTKDSRLAQRSDEEILTRTHILHNDHPTLASLYALGDYPQEVMQSLTVVAAVNTPNPDGSRHLRDLQHFTGPIPILLDQVMNWCRSNIPTTHRYRPDGHMSEEYEIPLQAVRELVSNALVHRDLSTNTLDTGKSIQIRLKPEGLMVQSPGGLRGVSLQQLESSTHSQAAVNRHLYSIAQKLHTADGASIIEGEGGGIQEVFRACKQAGLERPRFTDTGVQFTAFLWRKPLSTPTREQSNTTPTVQPQANLSKNEPKIIQALAEHGPTTFLQLQSMLELSGGQIRYALKKATEEGRITMEGGQGNRETTYRIPS